MKKHAIFLFCITALFMGFISCSTLQQDIIISQIPQDEIEELSDYEFRLVHLDADYSFSVQTDGSRV